MKNYVRRCIMILTLGIALMSWGLVYASSGGGSVETPKNPDIEKANQAIKEKNWDQAVLLLKTALSHDENNAEIFNLLGYSERNRGNLDDAFKYYDRALALDPKHRGAHEYIGEAYLMTGNLAKAEEQLAILDKLCFLPCEEYRELKSAIAEFKQKKSVSSDY